MFFCCFSTGCLLSACHVVQTEPATVHNEVIPKNYLTEKDLQEFIDKSGNEARKLTDEFTKAAWPYFTYSTPDTRATARLFRSKREEHAKKAAIEVVKFDDVDASPSLQRQVSVLKSYGLDPTPIDKQKAERLFAVTNELRGASSKTASCKEGVKCLDTTTINQMMAKSDSYDELLKLWSEAGEQYKPIKALFESKK